MRHVLEVIAVSAGAILGWELAGRWYDHVVHPWFEKRRRA